MPDQEETQTQERPIRSLGPSVKTTPANALGSGSTLLNLAASDDERFCFVKGSYYFLVGDSTSGKTWLSLTCFAEAQLTETFADYRLIFDDVENGALMDMAWFFGEEVAERIEPPRVVNRLPVHSATVEDFYFHLNAALDQDEPFIYVLDSQDALTSKAAQEKFKGKMTTHYKGTKDESAGSYGDGKAKYHSEHLRTAVQRLAKTGSILIIIGQTRDDIGSMFPSKTRSGGRALRFYATIEFWTSLARKIAKTVRGKERVIGTVCKVEVRKNRLIGKASKERTVEIPIFYSHGIDDIGSCVDYLVDEEHWKKEKQSIIAHELKIKATREKLIQLIEEKGVEDKVRQITGKVWRQVGEEAKPQRKRRYV